jgi:hypothetical protein
MFRRVENLRMWTRNTLHSWFLRSPHGFEKWRREGATTVRKKKETLALRLRGLYSPAAVIGSTDRVSVLPAVPRNYDREFISVYRPRVGSTGGSGSTDTTSVLPGNTRNSNRELISVLPTLCRLYRQFKQFLE